MGEGERQREREREAEAKELGELGRESADDAGCDCRYLLPMLLPQEAAGRGGVEVSECYVPYESTEVRTTNKP